MNTLITQAIIGTDQLSNQELVIDEALAPLLSESVASTVERRLLLAAGAWNAYRRAGYVPESVSVEMEAVPVEDRPACSSAVENLLQQLLVTKQEELLLEAFTRLSQANQRLPFSLLVEALNLGSEQKTLRPVLRSLLGARGYWLRQFQKRWSWGTEPVAEYDELPPDADTIWQTGTVEQRTALLRCLRVVDAARARQWVEEVWKQEKAENRVQLLLTCDTALSLDDAEWLERALDDRAEDVRTQAVQLLRQLPASAFGQRMLARGDAMLSWSDGRCNVTLPTSEVSDDWRRDLGIAKKQKLAGRISWLLTTVLSTIAPDHWVQRSGLQPEELIGSLSGNDWEEQIIESWTTAFFHFGGSGWAEPLWNWYCTRLEKESREMASINMLIPLGKLVGHAQIEALVARFTSDSEKWNKVLTLLPKPWSQSFVDRYLADLIDMHTKVLRNASQMEYTQVSRWKDSLDLAAFALSPACFEQLLNLEVWTVLPAEDADTEHWLLKRWQEHITHFITTIQLRKRIIEEIVL